VPADYDKAAEYLTQHTGYSFPILKPVSQPRVIRTLTAALRDNLSSQQTNAGLKIKMFAAAIFSGQVSNTTLTAEIKNMVAHITPGLTDDTFNSLQDIAYIVIPEDASACKTFLAAMQQQFSLAETEAALLLLAIAASYSPALINDAVIETVLKIVEPASIVEIVVWLSVLQLLNRLGNYYAVAVEEH